MLPLLLAASLGASASVAQASPGGISSRVRAAYERYGTVPPCLFSSQQLTSAQNAMDAYDLEYFADYIAAIQSALTLRAAGACSKGHAVVGAPSAGRAPPAAALPASVTSPTSSDVPVPMLLLAIFGLVLAAAATVLTLGRHSSPQTWPARWRHGTAEARYRAENAWDAFMARLRR